MIDLSVVEGSLFTIAVRAPGDRERPVSRRCDSVGRGVDECRRPHTATVCARPSAAQRPEPAS